MFTNKANKIFQDVINTYHILNTVEQPFENPYDKNAQRIEHLLYRKCWIDTDPVAALQLKRKIDASNQDRTDMVEYIDSYFLEKYKNVEVKKNAKINTESPAWGIDRLSILALKVFHMEEETIRENATKEHRLKCKEKLDVLLDQRIDLSKAIDQLLEDIVSGDKYMKVYKQMKMYNDDELNPVLRKK